MISIVLSTAPTKSSIYIQGIEAALNIAESESEDVRVFLDSDFSLSVCESYNESDHVKRLKQLFLFDVDVYSDRKLYLEKIKVAKRGDIQKTSDKVVVF